MSRTPGNAAETVARRAAANAACSRAGGSVSSRSAQPLPMKCLEALGARRGRAVRVATGFLGSGGRGRGAGVAGVGHVVHSRTVGGAVAARPARRSQAEPLQPAGESVATTGRWSLPAPSSSPTTRNASTCQPGVASTWSIGLPTSWGRSVGQVPSPPAPPATAASAAAAEVAAVDAATGEVVEGRVEVARHDHVLARRTARRASRGRCASCAAPTGSARPRARRRCAGRRRPPARRRSTAACSCCRAGRARARRRPRSRRGRAR